MEVIRKIEEDYKAIPLLEESRFKYVVELPEGFKMGELFLENNTVSIELINLDPQESAKPRSLDDMVKENEGFDPLFKV